MDYLTNDKLLKLQPSQLLSLHNSRSNSVSRFVLAPSQRNTHDPSQPLRSLDLFNRLEDILKSKQSNTTSRKKTKPTSCLLNSKTQDQKVIIENACDPAPSPFLNVYTDKRRDSVLPTESCGRKKTSITYLQVMETDSKQKKENIKKFKEEFTQMQEKIKSRNNSVVDFKQKDDLEKEKHTLKKLNLQLQEQTNNLNMQLQFEKAQNEKLSDLVANLSQQVAMLNKQLAEQQQAQKDETAQKDSALSQMRQHMEQLKTAYRRAKEQIETLTLQNQIFQKISSEMQELEQMCQQLTDVAHSLGQQYQVATEVKELFRVQNNIIEKVINRRDFPIEQLIMPKKPNKAPPPLQEQASEIGQILQQGARQLKSQIELLTEKFIQELLL